MMVQQQKVNFVQTICFGKNINFCKYNFSECSVIIKKVERGKILSNKIHAMQTIQSELLLIKNGCEDNHNYETVLLV